MLQMGFPAILIHILNVLIWIGIALWIGIAVRYIKKRRGSRGI